LLAQLTALPSGHGPAEALRQGSTRYLFSPLSEVARVTNDLSALGGLWLGTSQFLLNLYVTNVPIDPAVRRILSGEMAVLRIALVEEELAAIEYGEVAMKGVSDSERAWRVLACLQALRDESASLGPAINRPGNPGRLAVLFNEIQGFQIEALADERLDQLVQALRLDDPRASLREDAFQKAAAAFVRRLSVNYQDLADLVSPIITAVLFARFGMRCLARAMRLRQSAVPFPDPEILGFPTVRAIDAVQRSACLPTDDVRQQLLVASACLYEISLSGEGMSNFTSLKSPLDGLYQTWSTVRSREQQEAQEAESLYRVRKTDMEVLSNDELEAQEFAELFPQYDDLGEAAESMRMPNGAIHEEPRRFTPRHIASFHRIIVEAFDSTSRDSGKGLFPETLNELLATSFDVAASGEDLDHTSLAFQVHQLHQRYASNQALPSHANFYTSPNKPEIRKAHSIVTGLICRIDVLIAEWPEQMVLQHIRDRCDRLLNLDSNSPVAMILAALELLLQHTSDWESYANRDNSLKSYQQKISELIIDWRRLELSSWTRLLDDQASQYIASDAEWTIRLYGALIHGATSVNDNSGHIEALIPMIAMYLKSSTLGHFASRLSVLACFRRLTRELSQSDTGANRNLAAVSTMLHNVLANAGLFSGRIRESLGTQRAVIDRSIKDFVKLASWKDVNVFALKASSQKSHRQLYRSIRKFREVLQQPVAPMLADLSSVCAQDAPQASDPRRACNLSTPFIRSEALQARSRHEDALPEHLARLGDTFDRYQQVFAHTLPEWPFPHGSQLDAMAVDIIETAAALRKATPATLTKDNTKVVKNLASRKRKAFADLLKALRASGFSQSLRADLLRRQQSIEWMAARPQLVLQNLPESFDTSGLSKIESYHHRQVVLMTAMRAASNFHNPDMASQDLQRGIGFAESLFATALGERDQ